MLDRFRPEVIPPALPLVRGMTNHAGVVRLQEWLVVRGYRIWTDDRSAPGIDGDFGAGTQAGVEAFAKAHSIPAVVNDGFWSWLTMGMRSAFSFRPGTTDLGGAIADVARAHLAQTPREARVVVAEVLRGDDNSGPWVRAYNGAIPPAPWCQGAVNRWRDQAAAALGVTLKVPTTLDGIDCLWVPRVVEEHRRRSLFVSGRQMAGSIGPGCLFFVPGVINGAWSHVHVGVVAEVRGSVVVTIEGNTNTDGSANGWLVCQRERPIVSLDFGLVG